MDRNVVKHRRWRRLFLSLLLVAPATIHLAGRTSAGYDPMHSGDPNIMEARTVGPITWSWQRHDLSAAEKEAAEAHERQHRWNFWTGDQFFTPCWKLEQWAFRQEIPILLRRIDELQLNHLASPNTATELRVLRDRLEKATAISMYSIDAKAYCIAGN